MSGLEFFGVYFIRERRAKEIRNLVWHPAMHATRVQFVALGAKMFHAGKAGFFWARPGPFRPLSLVLGVFLLTTAALKAHGLTIDPLAQDSFLASPRLLVATTAGQEQHTPVYLGASNSSLVARGQ